MIIVGAGMAGLLAAGMIRDKSTVIMEAAPSLPNNHSAVLRFRSSIVGDALGIEFKAVNMMKCVHPWRNAVADSLAYAVKCTGRATLRSILTADESVQKRFIAPPNLIEVMADRAVGAFVYSTSISCSAIVNAQAISEPIISTIPMPSLMKVLGYDRGIEFNYVNGYNINCELPGVDAYVSVYAPDPELEYNRVSLTGSRLTIELSCPDVPLADVLRKVDDVKKHSNWIIFSAKTLLGLSEETEHKNVEVKLQKYSKILPIDDAERKRFISWASDEWGIYSLGRFATWRPGLLLDDAVNDVRVIQRIIKHGAYDHRKK